MVINFEGKRALVTGAGQGIGKEIALKLKKCGAKVVAMDKNEDTLKRLNYENPDIDVIVVDLSDWKATKEAVQKAGDIDLLVNNAGINILQTMGNITEEAIDKIFAINLKAPINISQEVSNGMKKRGKGGAIVNISSQAGIVVLPERTAYCSTKGGLISATKVMALELGPHQIRTNAVAPTLVDTELGRRVFTEEGRNKMKMRIPLGKLAETHHIADAVIFLLSDQAEMINGIVLPVDGGATAV